MFSNIGTFDGFHPFVSNYLDQVATPYYRIEALHLNLKMDG